MAIWAAREIQRRPGQSMLLFACLASLIFLTATPLLFAQAMSDTWATLMDAAPDLIVRRIDAGGWAPIPAERAAALASKVPGVINPTPRLWGVVTGPQGPVTVVAANGAFADTWPDDRSPPSIGEAVIGAGVARSLAGKRLELANQDRIRVDVISTFPAGTELVTHDLIWLHAADVRRLLGLAPGQASDLAIDLFRRTEEKAILADLAAALPWPVRITDRSTSELRHHTRAAQTGGIALVAIIPALLGLLLIITATAIDNTGRGGFQSLLKSMGWTTADIVRLQVIKALVVAGPSVVTGISIAYAAVFYPPAAGVTAFWINGGQQLPALTLDSNAAVLIMLEVAAIVGLPYLAAVFLTSLRGAAGNPVTLLQGDPGK